jgi:hypothetical protein
MNEPESLPYELVERDTATRITAIVSNGTLCIHDIPLTLEQILKVSIRYIENKGLIIIVIGRGMRSYGYYISPKALQRTLVKRACP